MTRIAYEPWSPEDDTMDVVRQAASICRTYNEQGYDITLRQLYYQFVARALIPNTDRSYKRLGSIVNKARLAGLLDWDYIVDRTRSLESTTHWSSPGDIVRGAARGYAIDKWADQDVRVEVWVEKEALSGVIERVADRWDCAWFACRGYVSQSELWGSAQRLMRYIDEGAQRVVILHLGDHDPSGIDMTRDIRDRLALFTDRDWLNAHADNFGSDNVRLSDIRADMSEHVDHDGPAVEVRRIALNRDQIDQYDPPPNPAKITDSRSGPYIERHGRQSWELDALDPATLDALIDGEIEALVDVDRFDALRARQENERDLLDRASARWPDVAAWLEEGDDDDA